MGTPSGLSADIAVSGSAFTDVITFFTLLYGKNHQFDTMDVLRQNVLASARPKPWYLPPTSPYQVVSVPADSVSACSRQ